MPVRPGSIVLVLLACASCHSWDIDPMEKQQKYRAYGRSEFFDDQLMMREPPPGTIPRERIVGNPALTTGLVGGTPVARIPMPITRELLLVGKRRFMISCAVCHGVLGNGDSEIARKMMLREPPTLYPVTEHGPPGRLFRTISEGYGLMPAYASSIPVRERWAVVAYLGALRLSQNARLEEVPADVRAELLRSQP